MIDIKSEQLLSLTEAARLLPGRRGGKRVHVSCMYRWTNAVCRGVVLESIQVGATRCTSKEALARFFARLTSPRMPHVVAPPSPGVAAAEHKLDRLLNEP